MSSLLHRGTLILVLAIAGIWPLAHHLLVERWEANPWKFGGWAMYSEPALPVLVAMFEPREEGFAYLTETALPRPTFAALEVFKMRRRELGKLLAPDDLASLTLSSRQDLFSLVVLVQRFRVDPTTAHMTSTRTSYRYERDGAGSVVLAAVEEL